MIGQILSWGCEGSVMGKQTQGLPQCPAERPKQSWGEIFFTGKNFNLNVIHTEKYMNFKYSVSGMFVK